MLLLRRVADETGGRTGPPTTGVAPEESAAKRRDPTGPPSLSAKELEVVRLLALGKTNRQVAEDLVVSLSTVKTYVERVMKKLGVSDRTQAAVRAISLGLLPEREG